MSNRKNAYSEVYTILQELNEEEYNKIPSEVIETIEANRDEDYEYELDDELELKEQQMYNTDIFANKPKENLIKNNNETIQIVEYKESIFKRILNKIKRFFIKK